MIGCIFFVFSHMGGGEGGGGRFYAVWCAFFQFGLIMSE